jgi:pyrimidine-specific ribonucleoside hydrolase
VLVEESVPTTLVPLDVTMRCAVDPGWVARLAASGPVGETIGGVLAHYRRRYREFTGVDRVPLHDAVAVLEACRPGTLATTPLSLEVVCDQGPARGALIADRRGPGSRPTDPDARLVDVALPDVLSADAVTALHEAVLTRLTAVPGPAPPRR